MAFISKTSPGSATCSRRRRCAAGWSCGALLTCLLQILALALPVSAAPPTTTEAPASNRDTREASVSTAVAETSGAADAQYTTKTLRGRVRWMSELLADRYGVRSDDDVAESLVALEATDGRIYPIVKDVRGRGFHKDPRMRDVDMELVVRQFEGSPMVQVVRVFTIKDGKRFEFDYWCDICAIPLYELMECPCCQGPVRIREREVTGDEPLE